MLKAAPVAAEWLHAVIKLVWATGSAPEAWKRALVVPLYKGKGDPRDPDNARGISLLSIVGKVYAIILAWRAAQQLEPALMEEQCGFRPQRGLVDAAFTLREAMAQCRQHALPLCLAFVDLRKAFDSVDRHTLWQVLRIYGLHPTLIRLIADLHTGTQAAVRLNGKTGPWFDVTRGVRQGCVLAPLLFNVFIDFVARQTLHSVSDCGITFAYSCNGELWEEHEGTSMRRVSMLLYADDMVLFAQSREGLQRFLVALDVACSGLGMAINAAKTKVVCMADLASGGEEEGFPVAGGVAESVESFKYLGGWVQGSGAFDLEVSKRIASAAGAFHRLQHIWSNRHLKVRTKTRLYSSFVLPALLFAAEAWPCLIVSQLHRLEVFHNDCLRAIMGVRRSDRHSVAAIHARCGAVTIQQHVCAARLCWLGHVQRMAPDRLPKVVCSLFGRPLAADGATATRRVGRPYHAWATHLLDRDMATLSAPGGVAASLEHCRIRGVWRGMCRALTRRPD
jgi:hypothetical protein